MKKFLFFAFLLIAFSSCFVMENTFPSVAPGPWRATLELVPQEMVSKAPTKRVSDTEVDRSFEELSEGLLPFVFEVVYKDEKDFYIEVINGEERIRLDDIEITHDRATNNDTIIIRFPAYGTYIKAGFEEQLMEGRFYNPARGADYSIPFRAKFGQNHRFTQLRKEPFFDVSGKWETTFEVDTEDAYPAIGEFNQDGNELRATFRTETGDYRFLEGTVQANKLYLSCFDGAHAFLFEAKLMADSSLFGSFRSGNHYKTLWEARRNPEAVLINPDSLTYLVDGYDQINFAFENPDGKLVSIQDEQYQGKIKIVQIMGTWCPNCKDETEFLVNYLKENNTEGLEVIALAFEKYKDKEKAFATIRNYKKQLDIPYEMLYAGYYNKKEAAKSLPMLNHILSYPTLIIIDRNNQVRRIHTGFSGPATSVYKDFVKDFDTFIRQLTKEQI